MMNLGLINLSPAISLDGTPIIRIMTIPNFLFLYVLEKLKEATLFLGTREPFIFKKENLLFSPAVFLIGN